jgi:hypothetical protein
MSLLLTLVPVSAQGMSIAWATYTYYWSGYWPFYTFAPGDMAAYGGFSVPHGTTFSFKAHVYPGVGTPDPDGWSPLQSTQWNCWFDRTQYGNDFYFFTVSGLGSIIADNRPNWEASVRTRIYTGSGQTKVILQSAEFLDQGTNGW